MADPAFAPAPGHGDEVLYAVHDRIGRVLLHRPRVVNALDQASVSSLTDQLRQWSHDDRVGAVVVEGSGERGLCAGGDVRALREHLLAGDRASVLRYWREEYALDVLVAAYPKPYLAWMDGVVMGGGVGISVHGSVRLVTARTRVAMPETIIGFFPDVGGLWWLARAPGELGTHLALTGLPVGGADAVHLGLADAVVPADAQPEVLDRLAHALAAGGRVDAAAVRPTRREQPEVEPALPQAREWIDRCYAGDDAARVVTALLADPSPDAVAAGRVVASRSPHSVVVTLAALRRAASLDLTGVLEQDARLGPAFADHPDFVEGVRALLVDRDQAPRWSDPDLSTVDASAALAVLGPRDPRDGVPAVLQ